VKRLETVSVVLPAYDAVEALPTVVRDLAVAAYALRTRGIELDVLVLNGDGDGSARAADEVASSHGLSLKVVDGPPSSSGRAFIEGFEHVLREGRADAVVTLDATGRHDASEVPRLLDALVARDLHVVIGSRWTRGSGTPGLSIARWGLGRLANIAFRVVTGIHGIADATTSFRIARVEVVRDVPAPSGSVTSHSVQTNFVAMAVANGYRVGEAPIIYRAPAGGGGGMGSGDVLEFVGHLGALRRSTTELRRKRLAPPNRAFDDDHFGAADDLEQLGAAKNFFDWVLDQFDRDLHGDVLEVGAGTGTITRKLVERHDDIVVTAIEPAENMAADLIPFAALHPRVDAHRGTLESGVVEEGRFDAALYLNVLEHIADDRTEVALAARALRPGGALLVFGPAHEWLYSDLDHKAGHYRRYSVPGLRDVVRSAGLVVESCRYFDILGVPPYWLVYRVLRHTDITGSTTWAYDRLAVPLSRIAQRALRTPPFGKNVVLVARKPG
jgi:SAM-dependent methyltransferase